MRPALPEQAYLVLRSLCSRCGGSLGPMARDAVPDGYLGDVCLTCGQEFAHRTADDAVFVIARLTPPAPAEGGPGSLLSDDLARRVVHLQGCADCGNKLEPGFGHKDGLHCTVCGKLFTIQSRDPARVSRGVSFVLTPLAVSHTPGEVDLAAAALVRRGTCGTCGSRLIELPRLTPGERRLTRGCETCGSVFVHDPATGEVTNVPPHREASRPARAYLPWMGEAGNPRTPAEWFVVGLVLFGMFLAGSAVHALWLYVTHPSP